MNVLLFNGPTYLTDFAALNAQLDAAFGYPDGKGTVTYAEPIVPPSQGSPKVCAMIIEDRCLPHLTAQQRADLEPYSVVKNWYAGMTPGNWTPPPVIVSTHFEKRKKIAAGLVTAAAIGYAMCLWLF